MYLAMNADKLSPQDQCVSTSNRHFKGQQGNGGRTYLMSPAMAETAAVAGSFADVRDYPYFGSKEEDLRKAKGLAWKFRSNMFATDSYVSPGAVVSSMPPYLQGNMDGLVAGATDCPNLRNSRALPRPWTSRTSTWI